LLPAGTVGGVVGGLIVRGTESSGNESSGTVTAAGATAAACAAATVADHALPSVVTVQTGNGSGSGVVIRSGGYIVTNNHHVMFVEA
jgi:putative serine protease PepD